MKDVAVAARYAKALFLVTEKRGETAGALGDLKGLLPVLAHGGRVADFLASPGVKTEDKRSVLRAGLGPRVHRTTLVFLDLLLRKNRLAGFETIVAEFEALVERAQGIQRAQVISAVPLSDAERQRLHRELERYTGHNVRMQTDVDPELVGGALVRLGDRVIDRSVRTLLEAITHQLQEVSL
jgi:F-type H+-transporting ATPase subunit delta